MFKRTHTQETKQKISLSRKGKALGNKNGFKAGATPWNKGLHINLNPNGGFKKGQLPHNTGSRKARVDCVCKICGKEFEEFVSGIKEGRGKYCSRECSRKGYVPWNKGLLGIFSGEKAWAWKGGLPNCTNCGKKLSARHGKYQLCKHCMGQSEERSNNISISLTGKNLGEKHWNWNNGITPQNKIIRSSRSLEKWRMAVFERDEYICQDCGVCGGILNAHHIKLFSKYPELRTTLSNGVTLCEKCHKLRHKKEK